MYSYATLAQIKVELASTTSDTSKDAVVLNMGRAITARIEKELHYGFVPYQRTRYFDSLGSHIYYGYQLDLQQPVMSITTLVDGNNTALTAWDGTYAGRGSATYTTQNYPDTPIWILERLSNSNPYGWTYNTYWGQSIALTGIYGYRTRYSTDAWLDSGDTLQANITSTTATTLTVADADGSTPTGYSPRFSEGQVIRIDSEYMIIVGISTNTLTVTRGALGTTAATHTAGASTIVYTFMPEPDIVRATCRWASYLYNRQGVYQRATFDSLNGVTVEMPQDMPEEIIGILRLFPRTIVGVGI